MTSSAFSLVRANSGLTRLTLAGRLEEADLLSFETELRVQLSAAPAQSLDVVIDLGAVTEFCHEGRDVLVRVHQFALTRARNLVFVATQPATRGLALWMMHMAGDRGATIADSLETALHVVLQPRPSSLLPLRASSLPPARISSLPPQHSASSPPPMQSHIRELTPSEDKLAQG